MNYISGISVNIAAISSFQIRLDLMQRSGPQRAEKPDLSCGNAAQRKRERKREGVVKEKSQTEQKAFGIHSGCLCVDCIAKYQRAERKLRALRYLYFTGIERFTAQQRGLDFALVQARHSSKVISYFATKAISTSFF